MRKLFALLAFALIAAPAAAQTATVSPGMSRKQVVAALGEPATTRTASEYTYLFYRNECGKACGMNDLVVLHGDSVVDAIFRSPSRHYTGTSSSPAPLSRSEARTGAASAKPMTVPKAAPATTAGTTSAQSVPVTKDVPTTKEASVTQAPRVPTAEQLAALRRELLGSGLTSSQIRARLRAQGYAENLLDADMRGAAAAQAAKPAMKPGAANDSRPSIPLNEPPVRPAPATPSSTKPPAP